MSNDDSAVNYLTPEQIRGKRIREGRLPVSDLRDRIADIDEKHYQIIANDIGWACACGVQMNAGVSYRGWRLHKADAVIEALPELNPDHIKAKYLKDWEEGYDEGYSAGGGGC